MPRIATKPYDWPALKAEYLSGVPLKDIAEKYQLNYNTIAVTANRKQWKKDLSISCQSRTQAVVNSVHDSLAQDAKRFTKIVTQGIIKASEALFLREMPANPYEANAQAGAMQKVNDMGRKTFGLEDNKITVQVGIIGQLPEMVEPAIEVQAQQITDATELPAEPSAPATPEPDQQGS